MIGWTIKPFQSKRGCLSYIIWCYATLEALIIDPSKELGRKEYERYLKKFDLSLKYIIETHTHADHVSLAGLLQKHTGAKILMHANAPSKKKNKTLQDGGRIAIGNCALNVIYTPGHTDDSITLALGKNLFTGDTLLVGSTGRTDFQNGNSSELFRSLWDKIIDRGDNVIIYPAHNYKGCPVSTIASEIYTCHGCKPSS
jgi:glyoxylase-like metal-dependent hydrolase (beta-lactamase superfamily II)